MASTLDELYTKSPGTSQVASTPAAQSSNATAGNAAASNATANTTTAGQANATNYDAQTQDVPTENLTSSRLNTITSQDSPLMQRARQEGMLLAARRGLQNSSIAAGTAQGAVVDRATPLATQEADILQGQRLANQNATNTARQFGAANTTDVSKTNAGLLTQANNLNAQLGTTVSQQNAQNATDVAKTNAQLSTQVSQQNAQNQTETSRFNSETAAQAAQQNAQAENAMRTAVMNQNADLNKQYLSGTQAQDLATIQAQYQALIQSNASAANLYNTYFQTIAQVMSNTNMDPSRVAQIVSSLQTSLVGGMDFLNAMGSVNSTGTAPAQQSGVPGSPNFRIPTTPSGPGTFNAAGGEAATSTGYLSNARQVLADNFAKQQPFSYAPSLNNATNGAGGDANVQLPPGLEASAYGGLLSAAGTALTTIGKDGSLLDSAGNVIGGVGGVANVVGGLQRGGAGGYLQAAAGATKASAALETAGIHTGATGALANAAPVVGAVAGGYETVKAIQAGDTKSAAISGASTGAAIGSVVPGIGTVVGAVLGGIIGGIGAMIHGKDYKEEKVSDKYYEAVSQGLNADFSLQALQPDGFYQAVAGEFRRSHSKFAPRASGKYGQKDEDVFLKDMANKINSAYNSGVIGKGDNADTVFAKVIDPWFQQDFGGWHTDSRYPTMVQEQQTMTKDMINRFINGSPLEWAVISGGSRDNPIPAYAGLDPAKVAQAYPTAPARTKVGSGGSGFHGKTYLR